MLYIEAALVIVVWVATLFGIRWLNSKKREDD